MCYVFVFFHCVFCFGVCVGFSRHGPPKTTKEENQKCEKLKKPQRDLIEMLQEVVNDGQEGDGPKWKSPMVGCK